MRVARCQDKLSSGCVKRELHYAERHRPPRPENAILDQDRAIRVYLAKHNGESTPKHARDAVFHYLQFLHIPLTDHAFWDLVQAKKNNPKDTTTEENILMFKKENPESSYANWTATILGIFHDNYAPVELSIHVSSNHKTKRISEPILLSLRNDPEMTQRMRDALDLMGYGAERIRALGKLPLKMASLVEGRPIARLDIPAELAKTHMAHPTFIPQDLYERLLETATKNGYSQLFPNLASVWRTITDLAERKYHVRLTSHYMRERFETIGNHIPDDIMPENHWVLMMGSKPSHGHEPLHYDLDMDEILGEEWERVLAPELPLTGRERTAKQSQLTQLLKENAELKEQLVKLTKLLTEKLTTP